MCRQQNLSSDTQQPTQCAKGQPLLVYLPALPEDVLVRRSQRTGLGTLGKAELSRSPTHLSAFGQTLSPTTGWLVWPRPNRFGRRRSKRGAQIPAQMSE